jgi:DNA replication protein DnaC
LLVDAEWMAKKEKKIDRFVRQANFRFPAVIEDIEYSGKHGITKKDVLKFSQCSYIYKKQNILVSGLTGIGKTYLICALGRSACYQCLAVRYFRTADLFLELSCAQLDGKYLSFRKQLSKLPLLILDDWGLKPFSEEESYEILELMELRYQNGSTIIASQLPWTSCMSFFPIRQSRMLSWIELFTTLTDSIFLVNRCERSLRRKNLKGKADAFHQCRGHFPAFGIKRACATGSSRLYSF